MTVKTSPIAWANDHQSWRPKHGFFCGLALTACQFLLAATWAVASPRQWQSALSTPVGDKSSATPSQKTAIDRKPSSARAIAPQWLTLHREQSSYRVVVNNPLYGPVDVQLDCPFNQCPHSVPPLPLTIHLAAREQRTIASIYPTTCQQNPCNALDLNVVAGPWVTDLTAASMGVYWLPFRNAPIHITQGFNGRASHHDRLNRYALDFALPVGTPIIASRDGVVMEVVSGSEHSGRAADGAGNFVRLLHADGALSLYAHLKPQAIVVMPGEVVKKGQLLGYSGDSGFSTGPHLHFAVLVNDHSTQRSIPFRMMTALGEIKFAEPNPPPSRP